MITIYILLFTLLGILGQPQHPIDPSLYSETYKSACLRGKRSECGSNIQEEWKCLAKNCCWKATAT